MKKLLPFLILLLSPALWAQSGNTVTLRFPGAPTGTCAPIMYAVNNATGDFYDCLAGSWNKVSGTGGGTVSSVFGRTGAVVAAANDYNFNQLAGSSSCSQLPALIGNVTTTAGSCSTTIAAGVVTNAMLVNASTTVNGQTCTLGSTCTVTGAPSGSAGGDLSGTYPNPTVAQVSGGAIPASAAVVATNSSKQLIAAPLTNTHIYVGNVSNLPVDVAVSGDVTLTNLGAITIANGAVTNAKLANSATTVNGQTCTLGSGCTVTAAPSGSAGGDLSGTYPNPGVAQVNGAAVPATSFFVGTNSSRQIISNQPFVKNAQTATYQVLAADFTACKTVTVASGTFTITLVASGSQPANGQCLNILNYGSGVVTVARSGQNINGGTTSLTINAGSATAPTSAFIVSDGTDYFATVDEGTVGTVTSVATTSPVTGGTITGTGTIACATCVTASAPGVGIAHFAGSTQAVTSSAVALGGADVSGQLPIGNVGSAGLSGTSPVTISSAGAIACATCTTNASALTNNVMVKGAGGQATQVSLLTDDGTTDTYTGTGGEKAPVFTATGTTAGFSDFPQGTTSSAVAPCNTATSICFQAPTSVTSQLRTFVSAPATGYSLWTNTAGSMVETITATTGTGSVVQATSPTITTPNIVEPMTVNGMAQYAVLTSDFTTPSGSGTGLLAITGLSFTLTASTAQNIPFTCMVSYSQATNVADAFGLGVSVAATRIDGTGIANTSTTAVKSGNIAITTSTTPTNIVGWTPTVTSVLPVTVSGIIQNPSTTSSTLQFYSSQATQADVIVWKAGSWCRLW